MRRQILAGLLSFAGVNAAMALFRFFGGFSLTANGVYGESAWGKALLSLLYLAAVAVLAARFGLARCLGGMAGLAAASLLPFAGLFAGGELMAWGLAPLLPLWAWLGQGAPSARGLMLLFAGTALAVALGYIVGRSIRMGREQE